MGRPGPYAALMMRVALCGGRMHCLKYFWFMISPHRGYEEDNGPERRICKKNKLSAVLYKRAKGTEKFKHSSKEIRIIRRSQYPASLFVVQVLIEYFLPCRLLVRELYIYIISIFGAQQTMFSTDRSNQQIESVD